MHHSGTVWVNRGLSFYAQNLQLSSAATQTRHITSTVLLTLLSSNQCSIKAVIEAVSLQLSSAATQTRHITSTVLLTLQSSNQCSVKAVIEAVSLLQYTIPSEVILLPGD